MILMFVMKCKWPTPVCKQQARNSHDCYAVTVVKKLYHEGNLQIADKDFSSVFFLIVHWRRIPNLSAIFGAGWQPYYYDISIH